MMDDYVSRRGNESPKTQHQRMSTIRQFALFMNTLGFNFYVFSQTEFVKKTNVYVPYIFTHEEMSEIWLSVDELNYSPKSKNSHFIYHMIIRLVKGCVFRINETITLQKKN